jgi:hopene-associated glycosyltransferase HpnB
MAAIVTAAAAAAIWIYLIALRGGFWRIGCSPAAGVPVPRSVAAVIPARDEAAVIGQAVGSLLAQRYPGVFHVVVVDDDSGDGTADIARGVAKAAGAADQLTVVAAAPVPAGWTGKLWAMRQGIDIARRFAPDYLLLTDADIVHPPGTLAELVARAEAGGYDLVSLMVRLHCRSLWERLLIPAFVLFFFKLFPPRRVADPKSRVAAAAGGCMLVRRSALERIGGVDSIRHEIIDDCALARRLKAHGAIWLGAAESGPGGAARSIREYRSWPPIWDMIARCAFAQLHYSAPALAATVGLMSVIYLAPPALVFFGPAPARLLAGAAWAMMSLAYLPMLRCYECSPALAPLLPLAALFYTAATVGSAIQYWRGRGGSWKGRFQAAPRVPG